MGMMANIACKTVGIAGMSMACYDAYMSGKKKSAHSAFNEAADTYESIIADTRTSSSRHPSTIILQQKIANIRMNNPIRTIFAKVTGFISGVLNSALENALPIICSSLAIAGKGKWAKAGAFGLGGCILYTALKEGFGVGKENPMGK